MKNFVYVSRGLQTLIISTCLVVLIFNLIPMRSIAQACLPNVPPIINQLNPLSDALPQFTNVPVVIFDRPGVPTQPDEFNAINGAIMEWNTVSVTGCSNITFNNATPANRAWDGIEVPPNNTIHVIRTNNTHMFKYYASYGVRAAHLRLQIDSTLAKPLASRVDNLTKHELGHIYGIGNAHLMGAVSIYAQDSFDAQNNLRITACDIAAHRRVYCPNLPTPTPTPEPTPPIFPPVILDGGCLRDDGVGNFATINCSPILIDVEGNGFQLTGINDGVIYDLLGSGYGRPVAWTAPGSDDAFLSIDLNNNGWIDNGKELFGNASPQPIPPAGVLRNGFNALAEYDKPANGGNGDGFIDARDAVFGRLLLWRDFDHNGVSESYELKQLPDLDIVAIELDYKESRRTDEFGNQFKYRAKIWDSRNNKTGRWAWDVFLVQAK